MAEGYKDWAAGDILTAADLEDYTVKQSVMRFADASARTTALSGVLAEGMMSYLKDTDTVEVYDGSAWSAIGGGGLVLVSRTTIGSAVSSVTVSGAFSADYDNYLVVVTGGTASTNSALQMIMVGSGSNHKNQLIYAGYSNVTPTGNGGTGRAHFSYAGFAQTTTLSATCFVGAPYLTTRTTFSADARAHNYAGYSGGFLDDANSYTDFTLQPAVGTITGGTIDVYGYAKA